MGRIRERFLFSRLRGVALQSKSKRSSSSSGGFHNEYYYRCDWSCCLHTSCRSHLLPYPSASSSSSSSSSSRLTSSSRWLGLEDNIFRWTNNISSFRYLSLLHHRSRIDKRGFCEAAAAAAAAAAIVQTDSDVKTTKKQQGKRENQSTSEAETFFSKNISHSQTASHPSENTDHDFSDVPNIFRMLLASNISGNMPPSHRDKMNKMFRSFAEGGWARKHASAMYIRPSFFASACSRFKRFFMHRCYPTLRKHLISFQTPAAAEQFLFPIFVEYCNQEFPEELARYRALVTTADLTKPHTWYPFTRAIRRRMIYHCGPTNSGKTYSALGRFMEASSGIYCSPLRLLAMEVFEKVNADGLYCSLVTGQEKKEVPFSQHLACTIEMACTQQSWEVAIIDEVQMINDEFRGWAWTRALLGLQADEVHVCGDPSALTLVRHLCALTGDILEEIAYERFKPLTVASQSLEGNIQNVRPGDCIIAFSRKEIFYLKGAIERATQNRCCVIYGSLPPETRTEQARLFNDPKSGFDVLVASDAVGMGLNLNIRRIVFYSMDKFNGEETIRVPPSQAKQIAGRAGRRGCLFPEGIATTFFGHDINYLRESLEAPYDVIQSAGLFPALEQMEVFASQMPDVTFSQLLDRFCETCRLDGSYFLCSHNYIKKASYVIDGIKDLSLEERFQFCFAPVNTRDPLCMNVLLMFATAYSKKETIRLPVTVPSRCASNEMELQDLETRHHVTSMYLWLSQHLSEEYFPDMEHALLVASDIAVLLGQSLAQSLGTSVQICDSKDLVKEVKKYGRKGIKQANVTSKMVDGLITALKTNRSLAYS